MKLQVLLDVLVKVIVLFFVLERIYRVDGIVNNGNILTDGRWKCHYHLDKRICWRE